MMKIETFEQIELTSELNEDQDGKQELALIERLGLDGQKELVSDTGRRTPYREMNIVEKKVYQVLFPEKTKVYNYKKSPIPLRVLQVIEHARTLEIYEYLEIWHERTKPVDPLLVGVTKEKNKHLLARWGEALEPFEMMYKKVVEIKKKKWKGEIRRGMAELKAFDESIECHLEKYFNGEYVSMPYMSVD